MILLRGGRRGSNPQQQAPQACALPIELHPPYILEDALASRAEAPFGLGGPRLTVFYSVVKVPADAGGPSRALFSYHAGRASRESRFRNDEGQVLLGPGLLNLRLVT